MAPNCSKRTKVHTCTLSAKKPSMELRRGDVFARRLDAHSPVSAVPARSASGLVGPLAMNLPNANDCCRAPAALANEAPVARDGPYPSPELVPSQPGRSRGRTHRHAISVPFRARRMRFATVNRGHSRSPDQNCTNYRCAGERRAGHRATPPSPASSAAGVLAGEGVGSRAVRLVSAGSAAAPALGLAVGACAARAGGRRSRQR